jgi:hypothetical protein
MPTEYGAHLLGRVHEPDARDWKMSDVFPAVEAEETTQAMSWADIVAWILAFFAPRPKPTPAPTPPLSQTWPDSIQLDQGDTPHCVGFGWAGWGNCEPVADSFENGDGDAIYYAAKVIQGQPKQENGSSVRAGAKAMQQRGRLATYVFAESVDDIERWVLNHGPVVVGTDWTNDMFSPDPEGYVRPTGQVVGGHCYLLRGYLAAEDAFFFQNSWGSEWGLQGCFKMKVADFARLLTGNGEACAATELPLG